jgi:hypothetical protein
VLENGRAVAGEMLIERNPAADLGQEPFKPDLARPQFLWTVVGYRLIGRKQDDRVRLFTRRGYDWTDRYPRTKFPDPAQPRSFRAFASAAHTNIDSLISARGTCRRS